MKQVRDSLELHTFTFDLVGFDGPPCFVGAFQAPDEEAALKMARKATTAFELPGWKLKCRETGCSHAAVSFFKRDPQGHQKPEKVWK